MPRILFCFCFLLLLPVCALATTRAQIQAACEAAAPEYLEVLRTLVNQDAGTHDMLAVRAKADMLTRLFTEAGATATLRETASPRANPPVVLATLRGTGKGRVLMLAHYDTVWPKGTSQKRPLRVNGATAYGPGVADAQHSVAAMVVLAKLLHDMPEGYETVTFLSNGDEERGSPASKAVILEQAAQHDVVFSMESGGDHGESVVTATSTKRPELMAPRGRVPFEAPPATMALAKEARKIFAELGRPLEFERFPVLTDANYACQKAPVLEGLGMGGGKWHMQEEFLHLEHVPARLYLLTRLVQEGPKAVR